MNNIFKWEILGVIFYLSIQSFIMRKLIAINNKMLKTCPKHFSDKLKSAKFWRGNFKKSVYLRKILS